MSEGTRNTVWIVTGHIEYAGFLILGVFGESDISDAWTLQKSTMKDPDSGFYRVEVNDWMIGETRNEHLERTGEDH